MSDKITKIFVCMGTSGLSAGAEKVAENFKKEIKSRKLSDKFEVVRVGDRGLFRDVLVDFISGSDRITYEYVKPEDVVKIAESHIAKGEPFKDLLAGEDYKKFFEGQVKIVLKNCGEIDPENIEDYIKVGGYDSLKKLFAATPIEIVKEVKASGLKGRGGAGFSTGMKWEFCHNAPGDEKYMVCNADEGDPGAFMDRSVLEGDPHAVIEGMIIAGYAIGAENGYIYCRAEYPLAIKRLNIAMAQAREKGFLGKNISGSKFSFDITIKEGAGAFVCG
ncbi:MAG: NADH-quinone oxidoreductase subunit J/K, partial [Elusimicrobiales bacterium]|nr:NADH-quinone oxidoreductase subunit J/K [Elusimicrobiales bacterium]